MRKNIFWFFIVLVLSVSCHEQNVKKQQSELNTNKTTDDMKLNLENYGHEYVFKSDDSVTVILRSTNSAVTTLQFTIKFKDKKFEGVANLELIEDNGKFYLPESTSRFDELTNKEYMCDSTFSYHSENISFVFAMENQTQERLSFIINNSLIEGIEDDFYTLHRAR